jgi:hypothetical protein
MSLNQNHTPLPNKLGDSQTTSPITTSLGKELEPISIRSNETAPTVENNIEDLASINTKRQINPVVKKTQTHPNIPKEAKDAGLALSPSATHIPTIYDVKVPIFNDEQIETNLHKSFFTGARWLAEFCRYLLLQSHIRIKKIGDKIIRQKIT